LSHRLEALAFGRVQGVGYRAFVARAADRLKLTGFAKNLDDGSVAVVAEGPEDRLRDLVALLQQGPSFASVERVEWSIEEGEPEFGWFSVE